MLKRALAVLLAAVYSASFLVTLSVISGCNTVEGAGKDIERGGRAIKEEARERR
jgi:predicted small secreted protein